MKNKRANLDIVIFTIMILIICVYFLVQITVYNKKFYEKIRDYEKTEEALLEKKDLEYHLEKILEKCIIKSYKKIVENKEFYEEKERESINFFNKNKEDSGENLKRSVEECIKKYGEKNYQEFIKNYEIKPFLNALFARLKNKNFEIKQKEEEIEIIIKNFTLTKHSNKELKHNTNLFFKVKLKRIGILPFEDINKTTKCKKEEICIKEINKNIFNVNVEEKSETKNNKKISYLAYNFTSLKEFYIDENFEKISFDIKFLDKIEPLS